MEINELYVYDETSPTCLRWAVDIYSGRWKNFKNVGIGDVAGGLGNSGDYRVYHLNDVYEKTTLKQRLNVLWLVPVWWIIAPFKWVFTGKAGVSQHSKVGKWLAKITGL